VEAMQPGVARLSKSADSKHLIVPTSARANDHAMFRQFRYQAPNAARKTSTSAGWTTAPPTAL
jgi:hypothetical protein